MPYYGGWCPDFPNDNYSELYYGLFKQLGLDPSSVSVNKKAFQNGFVVFPFEITGKDLSSEYYGDNQSGNLELTMEFSAATETNVAIMVVLENEKVISFNKNREFKDSHA